MVKTYQVVWDKIAVEDLKDILSYLKKSSDKLHCWLKRQLKSTYKLYPLMLLFLKRIS